MSKPPIGSSGNGFQTRIWGFFWFVLHMISFNFPTHPTPEQKQQYLSFFASICHVLPCSACRRSTAKFYKSGDTALEPRVFESRETLSRWVWRLHNRVNKRLHKPPGPSYERVRRGYESFRAVCDKKKHSCVAPPGVPRKRSVVLIVTDEQYDKLGFTDSIMDLTRSPRTTSI